MKKKKTREQRYTEALEKIAGATVIKHDLSGYSNIAKNAIYTAKEALHEPCPKCGK